MFDLYPPEQEEVLSTCRKIMIDDTAKEFDWLIVPLDVEFAITEVNGSWFDKKPL